MIIKIKGNLKNISGLTYTAADFIHVEEHGQEYVNKIFIVVLAGYAGCVSPFSK